MSAYNVLRSIPFRSMSSTNSFTFLYWGPSESSPLSLRVSLFWRFNWALLSRMLDLLEGPPGPPKSIDRVEGLPLLDKLFEKSSSSSAYGGKNGWYGSDASFPRSGTYISSYKSTGSFNHGSFKHSYIDGLFFGSFYSMNIIRLDASTISSGILE